MPAHACDCHMHLFGPASRFPYATARSYTPPDAAFEDYAVVQRKVGLSRFVIVLPSVYGTDNRSLVDAMVRAKGRARGVAVLGRNPSPSSLEELQIGGVRGVRINLASTGDTDLIAAAKRLLTARDQVGPLGWHIQIHAALPLLVNLADPLERVMASGVPIVFDHLALALDAQGQPYPELPWLEDVLRSGRAWIKASAYYRVSRKPPDYPDAVALARRLIGVAPQRVLWASDWPNTGEHGGLAADGSGPPKVAYRPINAGASLNLLADSVSTPAALHQILVDNPAALYGFAADD
jgi:predicted TIM-barrel fold metal-dependent hydrolase